LDLLEKVYLTSQRSGRWRRIAKGAVSAARMMISEIPTIVRMAT